MREAKEFLDLVRRRFPSPRSSQNHSLTLQDGILVLTLMQGDTYQRFNFDDEDLRKAPAQLLSELIAIMKTQPKPSTKKPEGPDSVA